MQIPGIHIIFINKTTPMISLSDKALPFRCIQCKVMIRACQVKQIKLGMIAFCILRYSGSVYKRSSTNRFSVNGYEPSSVAHLYALRMFDINRLQSGESHFLPRNPAA